MKSALVTGAASFIGSHLVDLLLDAGWQVTIVDNFNPFYDPQIKRQNIASHLSNPNYTLGEADIRDLETLCKRLSEEYDVMVHLAAKSGVRSSIVDPSFLLPSGCSRDVKPS